MDAQRPSPSIHPIWSVSIVRVAKVNNLQLMWRTQGTKNVMRPTMVSFMAISCGDSQRLK